MRHKFYRVITVLVGIALLVSLTISSAFAQGERKGPEEIEKRLEEMDREAQEEAVAVIRVAVEYLIGGKVKVYPAGFISSGDAVPSHSKPVPEKVHAFAKLLANVLGTETASFERDEVRVSFVATSIPEIQSAEARVEVHSWAATREGYATRTDGLELEREPNGPWKVARRSSYEHSNILNVNLLNVEAGGTVESDSEAVPPTMVDDRPQIMGGQEALHKVLKYPEATRMNSIEDPTVFLQFIVAPDGQVRNLSVLSTPHEAFSKEAKRALRKMRFEPGRQNGKAVPVRMSIPIRFKK